MHDFMNVAIAVFSRLNSQVETVHTQLPRDLGLQQCDHNHPAAVSPELRLPVVRIAAVTVPNQRPLNRSTTQREAER